MNYFDILEPFALSLVDWFLSALPSFDLPVSLDYFFDILTQVAWFLPMNTIYVILFILRALFQLRLTIAILKSIWSILPVL